MNVRCEENLWAFNFLLWTRTRIVKSSRGQKWDTLKKKQHSPSYSRDNGFNLLCMKRDIGRENPERAECFTGQEETYMWFTLRFHSCNSAILHHSLLPKPQSECPCPALLSGKSKKMKNNSGAIQKPRLLSPSQCTWEGQMFGFCWIKLLAGDEALFWVSCWS